ncbi:Uncharacterised protein [Mycobacteroides abscessus subsp. abscessus]|nr:Uncharacterised protein [Mycobacteroides abscessus subsp. abscessus]
MCACPTAFGEPSVMSAQAWPFTSSRSVPRLIRVEYRTPTASMSDSGTVHGCPPRAGVTVTVPAAGSTTTRARCPT